jgi:hypothetical protein
MAFRTVEIAEFASDLMRRYRKASNAKLLPAPALLAGYLKTRCVENLSTVTSRDSVRRHHRSSRNHEWILFFANQR